MHNLEIVRGLLGAHGVEAVLLTALPDVRWACGFSGSHGALVVQREGAHFVTDGRYRAQAEREVEGASVHVAASELYAYVASEGLLGAGADVLFQADDVTAAQLERWRRSFPEVTWRPAEALLTPFVAVKSPNEVAAIGRAQAVTDAVFQDLLGLVRPGVDEREVAAEIVYGHLRRGAERMSFDPIVASGPQGALPHARPSHRKLQAGDLVVLDMGCFVDGYASDMTRTVALGEPGEEARRVYQVVLDAQRRALDAARPGLTTRALDAAARTVIEAAGYGPCFTHGLGHGVGLQIHEWPRISSQTDDVLPEGAVVTIEPGIYLPGRFGVRIEDLVVLRTGGPENLTRSPKDLLIL